MNNQGHMATGNYTQFSALLRARKFADALHYAERQASGENGVFWLTQQAVALNRIKEHKRARECAERVLQSEPGNAYAALAAAEACLGLGQSELALRYYEEVSRVSDERAASRAAAGMLECLARDHSWDRMLSVLASARTAPNDACRFRVIAFRGLGRADEALAECRRWLAEFPDNHQALWAQTELEVECEGLETVRERMGKLARIASRPPIYAEIYASLCRKAGIADAALGLYDKLQAQTGGTRAIRQKAFTLAKSGREQEAVAIMEELLRDDPRDIYLHTSYAAACGRLQCLGRAAEFYRTLLARYPDEKGLYGRLRSVEKKMNTGAA